MGTSVQLTDGRVVDINDLGGLSDVADRFGWPVQTVTTWKNRYSPDELPPVVLTLRRGDLYVISDWEGFTPPGRARGVKDN